MVKPKRNIIYGIMLRPASINEADNERIMQGTAVSVTSDFYKQYSHYIGAMQIVAECAKIYITKHWQEVKDWSDLNVVMEDTSEEYIEYYNYKERAERGVVGKRDTLRTIFKNLDERNKQRHNPAHTVTDVVLDPSDGDFSLTINGRVHMWISDSTVIIIANYIEKQLKKQQNNSQTI